MYLNIVIIYYSCAWMLVRDAYHLRREYIRSGGIAVAGVVLRRCRAACLFGYHRVYCAAPQSASVVITVPGDLQSVWVFLVARTFRVTYAGVLYALP